MNTSVQTHDSPDGAHRHCARVVRSSGSSFASTFWMLPRRQRRAMHAIYAFCRLADDIADDPAVSGDREQLLSRWRAELEAAYAGQATHPVGLALSEAVRRFPIRKVWLEDLLAGVEMDLAGLRFQKRSELERYCYCVASTVGLAVVSVLGVTGVAVERYAVQTGLAVQITNILRDVGTDAAAGRVYLAGEDLDRHRVTREQLECGAMSPGLVALLSEYAGLAHAHFDGARAVLPSHSARRLRPAEAMSAIYRELLADLEAEVFPCFDRVVRLSRPRRIGIAARTWLFSSAAS